MSGSRYRQALIERLFSIGFGIVFVPGVLFIVTLGFAWTLTGNLTSLVDAAESMTVRRLFIASAVAGAFMGAIAPITRCRA